MKKTLLAFLLIAALIVPQAAIGADHGEAEVRQTIDSYFALRYEMLSSLVFDSQIRTLLTPELFDTKDAINEEDVLDAIVSFRKAQMNDLRFDRYKMELNYDQIEISGDRAWLVLDENYELYFKCAPTVRNLNSIQHMITLKKIDEKWYVLRDDYEDPEGIKKKLAKYFIEKQMSLDEAKAMIISESEGQLAGRIEKLNQLAEEIGEVNPLVLGVEKPIAYSRERAGKIDGNSAVTPVVLGGRTLLPIRFIAGELGAKVDWDGERSAASIYDDEHRVEIIIGEKYIEADGKNIALDVPATLMNGRTMVPVRAVADIFGKELFWDDRGLIILSDKELDTVKHKKTIDRLAEFYSVLYTKADFPKIDGSTATYPLSIEMGRELLGLDEMGAKGFITHNTTHNAYVNLIDGKADIIFVTQPSPEELELAAQKGVELEVIPVCREGFVFLVNENNPVEGLTSKQVQDIYQGSIKDWKEVGGEKGQIIAYQREPNSGSQTIMENTVMKGLKMADAPKETLVYGMGELIDRVADYSNAKNALGYSVYYYATQMYQNRSVKLLDIDGVEPVPQTIKDGSYPFTVGYYAVMRKGEPDESSASRLLKWLLGEEGQKIVDRAGLVPVK